MGKEKRRFAKTLYRGSLRGTSGTRRIASLPVWGPVVILIGEIMGRMVFFKAGFGGRGISEACTDLENPDSRQRLFIPGDESGAYILEIRVSMIMKASCGGVKAVEVLREKVEFRVSGMDS